MVAFAVTARELLESVGRTPLVNLNPVNDHLFAKEEFRNPAGSLKWRPAVYMVCRAILRGEFDPSRQTDVEASAGQMALARGLLSQKLGYRFEAVIWQYTSPGTKEALRKVAADVIESEEECPTIFVDRKTGELVRVERDRAEELQSNPDYVEATKTDQAIGILERLVEGERGKYFWPNQYSSEDNFLAHFETTGPEIEQQLAAKPDFAVVGVGTGGSLGWGAYLKQKHPEMRLIAVTPRDRDHFMQGLRNLRTSMVPPLVKRHMDVVDEWVEVSNAEAAEAGARLLRAGFHAGPSSWAVAKVADDHQRKHGGVGVLLFGDGSERYKELVARVLGGEPVSSKGAAPLAGGG